jgi:hypothetical protein
MQESKSARNEILSKLRKLGMNTECSLAASASDEQLEDILAGLAKIRDNKLARFIVSLMQFQR